MDASNPPVGRKPVVNFIRRPRLPRALTLLFVLHPTLLGLGAFFKEKPVKAAYRKHPYKPSGLITTAPPHPDPPLPQPLSTPDQTENVFINALAQAAMCHKHARPQPHFHINSHEAYGHHKARRRNILRTGRQNRYMHQAATIRPAITRTSPSREEYLNLVDTYRELYSTQAQWMEPTPPPPLPFLLSPTPTNLMPLPPIMGRPFLADKFNATPFEPIAAPDAFQKELPLDQLPTIANTQSKLIKTVRVPHGDHQRPEVMHLLGVLEKPNCVNEEAYKAYSALPTPGVSYLSEDQIRLLFRRLSTTERKDRHSALRYLSVVDDMKALNLPLVQAEWNSAISFCGQCFSHIHSGEVENALVTWKEMENEANVESNFVTFNILFDMAARAGKFVLADMILKEMDNRGLQYNRYFRVGNIYFNGLRGDGDGVRRAYRELVDAREIVDTVVMNCVIAALISAGELPSAENVYDRMKRMLSSHTDVQLPTSRTWQDTRNLGRILDRLARNSRSSDLTKKGEARLALLKEQISIVPNIHTYAIFIEHHAWQTGDLHRISALLNEMQTFGVAIQGRIFLKLFKGFSKHGGNAFTQWTPQRLKSVWNSLLAVLDHGAEDVRIGKWMIIWAVRAFDQCAGREWALHVWEEMTARWKPESADFESAHNRLRDVLKADRRSSLGNRGPP